MTYIIVRILCPE